MVKTRQSAAVVGVVLLRTEAAFITHVRTCFNLNVDFDLLVQVYSREQVDENGQATQHVMACAMWSALAAAFAVYWPECVSCDRRAIC